MMKRESHIRMPCLLMDLDSYRCDLDSYTVPMPCLLMYLDSYTVLMPCLLMYLDMKLI